MPDTRLYHHLRWLLPSVAAFAAAWILQDRLRPSPVAKAAPTVAAPSRSPANVGSLGHFLPENGLLRIAAPYYQSRPSVVARLAVEEGQLVKPSQLIAVLDGKPQVEAERASAMAQIALARSRLQQVRAGAKPSEQEAQRAEVERMESSHRHEQLELARYEKLFAAQQVSVAVLEEHRVAERTNGQAVEAARHRLAALREVRSEDVRVAESELAVSEAQLREIETRLAALTVFAPAAGTVVRIHARAGEQPGPEGILEMADTARMAVEAEVYASDLPAVRLHQRAWVEPEETGRKMMGEVIRIGTEVRRATIMPGDPATFNDARVVPVRIRVPACANEMPCPINGRVKVVIETGQ